MGNIIEVYKDVDNFLYVRTGDHYSKIIDGTKYYKKTNNLSLELVKSIPISISNNEFCECGGNVRVGLDCTMKPCKHPHYIK